MAFTSPLRLRDVFISTAHDGADIEHLPNQRRYSINLTSKSKSCHRIHGLLVQICPAHDTLLAPSILAGDHANLRSSLKVIEDAGLVGASILWMDLLTNL